MEFWDTLYCIVVTISMVVAMSIFLNEKRAGVSPAPTMPSTRRVVIDLLREHTRDYKTLRLAELGSGWGGLAIKIANSFPCAAVTGFEISPYPRLVSRLMTMFNSRITILCEDFYDHDLTQYDALICYLSPQHMQRIEEKLQKLQNKPLVISCSFSMPNTTPSEVVTFRQLVTVNVYVYHSGTAAILQTYRPIRKSRR
jgi:cyclopropane fatty-acyl-phospholipid synthase-like methyltransferase